MPVDPAAIESRIAAVLGDAHELRAYERWLDEQREVRATSRRDYLFSEDRPRFEPRKDDVVVPLPNLAAKKRSGGC